MKTPVAVTLIVMGALIVMTPAVSDFFYQRNIVALMSRPEITTVNLDGKMGDLYRIGCWLAGSGMIGITLLCSVLARRVAPEHDSLAAHEA